MKRFLIFVHRWLGVVLCLVFLLWFPSGIGMMYWDFPSVSAADRLERSPALRASAIQLSPSEAFAKSGLDQPGQIHLSTFDGRPVYRFRSGGGESVIYADTGEEQIQVSREMMDRIAASWARQPARAAIVEPIHDVDQWTVQTRLSDVEPLWKYSWSDGQQAYVSQASGEIVQYTTRGSRWGAYVGAIPHWLYFTPLRTHGPEWSRVVIWSSAIGTFSAVLGMVIGLWMYSPSKKYRFAGTPTSIPYRGQKRWHMLLGLIFGIATATWAFSGMLSMDPFPLTRPAGQQRAGGGRRGGGGIPQALRGRLQLSAFDAKHPREALTELGSRAVKELEFTSFAGEPVYLASLDGGQTWIVPLNAAPQQEFDRRRIVDVVTKAAEASGGADVSVIDQYDRYYLDRHREKPLPVLLVRLNDADHTRYYIDPRTARVVGSYSARNWISRWLYHGLHSLDFPWLYNYRPLWDIVVITFMLGGTALAVTSLVLAWRVLGRKLRGVTAGANGRQPIVSEDLV